MQSYGWMWEWCNKKMGMQVNQMEPTSPTAIRIYLFLGALISGALIAWFVIIPAMRNTCFWFTSRCAFVEVSTAPDGKSLLVTNPASGKSYVYDGSYIFSYGNNVPGVCPRVVATGTSPLPVTGAAQTNFCFRMEPTPDDPACLAGDESKCAKCTSSNMQCARASKYIAALDKFSCDGGVTTTDTAQCCAQVTGCESGGQCLLMPTYNETTKKYSCGGTSTPTTTPVCCNCSRAFQPVGFSGSTQAQGDILKPVYAIDAATMTVTGRGDGVVCAPQANIMMARFNGVQPETVKINVPADAKGLDVYQIFDVLKKRGTFIPPS